MDNTIPIENYLNDKGISFIKRNGELITKCVFGSCDEDSRPNEAHLYFDAETGQYHCKKCGEKGNTITLAKALGDDVKSLFINTKHMGIKKPSLTKTKALTPDFQPITNEEVESCHAALPPEMRTYLNNRGITDEIINQYKLGWGTYYGQKWITIPISDFKGVWSFFKLRKSPADNTVGPKMKVYPVRAPALLYNSSVLNGNMDYTVICEGELDALALTSQGVTAVTSTAGAGTFKPEWIKYFKELNKIYVCYDNDKTGKDFAPKVAGRLVSQTDSTIYLVDLPDMGDGKKDVTDYLLNGGSRNSFFTLAEEFTLPYEESGIDLNSSFKQISPAQDFIGLEAYFCVPQMKMTEHGIKMFPYILKSSGEKIPLTAEALVNNGLYTDRLPNVEHRWSEKSIERFITEKGTGLYDSLPQVLEKIVNTAKRYIDFQNESLYMVLACWIVGTYLHRAFYSFPYIHLNGNKESGKTKTLQFAALTAFNAELSANNTPSFTIRVIHHNNATMLLDEVESYNRAKDDESKAVIGVLNAGYKKGAQVGKAEQVGRDQTWTPKKYDAYSPKIFAGIQGLESTLASRCIQIIMVNSTNKALKNSEIRGHDEIWQEIRDSIYLITMTSHNTIRDCYATLTDDELVGREWELWKPLLSIAKAAGDEYYATVRSLALETQKQRKELALEDSETPKMLLALHDLLLSKLEPEGCLCSVVEIIDALDSFDHEQFGWLKNEKTHNPGRWVGNLLRRSKIVEGSAKSVREDNGVIKKYYLKMDVIKKRMESYDLTGYEVTNADEAPEIQF